MIRNFRVLPGSTEARVLDALARMAKTDPLAAAVHAQQLLAAGSDSHGQSKVIRTTNISTTPAATATQTVGPVARRFLPEAKPYVVHLAGGRYKEEPPVKLPPDFFCADVGQATGAVSSEAATVKDLTADPARYEELVRLGIEPTEEAFDLLFSKVTDIEKLIDDIEAGLAERESFKKPGYDEVSAAAEQAFINYETESAPLKGLQQSLEARRRELDIILEVASVRLAIIDINNDDSPEKMAAKAEVDRLRHEAQNYMQKVFRPFCKGADGNTLPFTEMHTPEDVLEAMAPNAEFQVQDEGFRQGFIAYALTQGEFKRVEAAYENQFGTRNKDLELRELQEQREADPEISRLKQRIDELEPQLKELKKTADDLTTQVESLTDKRTDMRVQGQTMKRLRQLSDDIAEFRALIGSLVSWSIQHAVDSSATDLATYYRYVAMASQRYIQFYRLMTDRIEPRITALAETESLRSFKVKSRADADKLLGDMLRDYGIDKSQYEWMTLPQEQKGRGEFYNVQEELRELGLLELEKLLPDRVPLLVRVASVVRDKNITTIEAIDTDKVFQDRTILQFYDLGLRTALGFRMEGEYLPTDGALLLLIHGTGTSTSTLKSIERWSKTMANLFPVNEENDDKGLSAVIMAQPQLGYGTRDTRFLPNEAKETIDDDIYFATLANPRLPIDYFTAVIARYAGYRQHGVKVGFGGRSTGGTESQIHREATAGTKDSADFYINMSAISGPLGSVDPSGSDRLFPFTIFHDITYLSLKAAVSGGALVMNIPSLWFTLAMFNSAATYLNMSAPNPDAAPILHMGGGLDTDYPQIYPPTLNLEDEETRAWVDYHVDKVALRFAKLLGQKIPREDIESIYINIILRYKGLLKRRYGWSDQEIDSHWQEYVAHMVPLDEFWKQDRERNPDNTWVEFDTNGTHNRVDSRIQPESGDSDELRESKEAVMASVERARRVMKDFIEMIMRREAP